MISFRKALVILLFTLLAGVLILDFNCEQIAASPSISQKSNQTLQTNVDGKNVTLMIKGNVSVAQISNLYFETFEDWYNNTHINFDIRGLNGSAGFVNMTVPKNAILGGTEPVVATNGGRPESQGFSQDDRSFYVWFTTLPEWDNNDRSYVSVLFLLVPHQESTRSSINLAFFGLVSAIIIVVTILILVRFKQKNKKSEKTEGLSL